MSILETHRSYRQIETVIDIAVALADYTQSAEQCREIPAFLAQAIGLEGVTLAVVRHSHDDSPAHLVMCHSSLSDTDPDDRRLVQAQLRDLHRRYKAQAADAGSEFAQVLPFLPPASVAPGAPETAPLGGICFGRAIDRDHDLLLMIHHSEGAMPMAFEVVEDLRILADELCKQLECMLASHRIRSGLGAPFTQLSDQEWVVLRGLTSESSEKQLADQLKMRPHTLHSRIKAIYRKVDVQGRLPLIQKYQSAVTQMRIEMHRSQACRAQREASQSAIGTCVDGVLR